MKKRDMKAKIKTQRQQLEIGDRQYDQLGARVDELLDEINRVKIKAFDMMAER